MNRNLPQPSNAAVPGSPRLTPAERGRLWNSLTGLQQKWFQHYVAGGCSNATQAAIQAGYSGTYDSMRQRGYDNRHNPKIQKLLQDTFASEVMSAEEALSRVSEEARSTAEDFVSFRTEYEPVREYWPIGEAIDLLEIQIAEEEAVGERAPMDEDERKQHARTLREMKQRLVRYQLTATRDPEAHVAVDRGQQPVEVPYVDLEKMKAAGKLHLLKGLKYDANGRLAVDLYDAQKAKDMILKAHGVYREREDEGPQTQTTNVFVEQMNVLQQTDKK